MSAATEGILVVGASVIYAIVGVLVVRRLLKGKIREGHNDVLAPLFATAGVIYAVLLGFLVVSVWASYDNAKSNIEDEATNWTTLYRLTAGMRHADQASQVRAAAREYTHAVIEDEWKSQQTGNASADARAAMGKMYQTFHTMPLAQSGSQINGEYIRTLSNVTLERNRRIVQASESLPWVMWLGLIAGGAIMVGMTFILYMEAPWPHVLVSAVLASLVGSLLYVTLVLNRPFEGPMALTPEPFEYAQNLFDSVDRGQ